MAWRPTPIKGFASSQVATELRRLADLLEQPQSRTVTTPTSHFFAALYTFVNLEWLQSQTDLNHYALKSKIYLSALFAALQPLRLAQA